MLGAYLLDPFFSQPIFDGFFAFMQALAGEVAVDFDELDNALAIDWSLLRHHLQDDFWRVFHDFEEFFGNFAQSSFSLFISVMVLLR